MHINTIFPNGWDSVPCTLSPLFGKEASCLFTTLKGDEFSKPFVIKGEAEDDASSTQTSSTLSSRQRKRKRHCFSAKENVTISLEHTSSDEHEKSSCEPLTEYSQEITERVSDHAYRRVQIFYYQLLAYYKEGCDIERASTNLQHGVSSCENCQAAHSAILPHVTDNFQDILVESLMEEGLTDLNTSYLEALQIDCQALEILLEDGDEEGVYDFLEKDHELLTSSTYLYHLMNSTVTLPKEVNMYDSLLEKHLRPFALDLLNQVSKEELHPYKALEKFTKAMQECIVKIKEETEEKLQLLKDFEVAEKELFDYEKQLKKGPAPKDRELLSQYLTLFLRQQALIDKVNTLKEYSFSIPLKKRLPQHQALFTTLTQHGRFERDWGLKKFDTKERLYLYIQETIHRYQSIKSSNIHQLHLLRCINRHSTLKEMQDAFSQYWENCDLVALLLEKYTYKHSELATLIKDTVLQTSEKAPPLTEVSTRLKYCLKIGRWQAKGSVLPEFSLLSGKRVGNRRVPFDDEELIQQKYTLIKRTID